MFRDHLHAVVLFVRELQLHFVLPLKCCIGKIVVIGRKHVPVQKPPPLTVRVKKSLNKQEGPLVFAAVSRQP